ncbi:MAG: enoyl-CoA hydratase [Deltaproteobacteria bacterium]|nr:enoyl-CoA hydratase [Deltaproteobacteria bacterium]
MIEFSHIDIVHEEKVLIAYLNRPKKANALNRGLWFEIEKLANWVNESPDIRVLILAGNGNHFTSGIDFSLIQEMSSQFQKKPQGIRQEWLYREIRKLQDAFSALETCSKPVLAAIHGSCIGGGVDLISACDMRYSTEDARFCVKEIDLAIVADIGTIQRLPTIIGEGMARELTLTARPFSGQEAKEMKLVNRTYPSKEEMMDEVKKIAQCIAEKSPISVRNTKRTFVYGRDHSVQEGLEQVARLNAGILFSADSIEAMTSMMQKKKPSFLDS